MFDSFDIYYLHNNTFVAMGADPMPWKTNVPDVNSTIVNVPTSQLSPGPYVLLLMATPTGRQDIVLPLGK